MGIETRTQPLPDLILETLRTEITGGTEILSAWIRHLHAREGIGFLFEFEVWLRALRAFFNLQHLPLDEAERSALVTRNFASEIRIARLALRQCEEAAVQLSSLGSDMPIPSELVSESRAVAVGSLQSQMGAFLDQSTPMDSLDAVLEAIDDLGAAMDALADQLHQDLKLFLGFGRMFHRSLRSCRYMDLLIAQRFRPEYDRVDNTVLSAVLRSIPGERERRNLTLSLLYLHRFLRYLKLVATGLENDRPLRVYLAVFALLHEQSEAFCDFLRSRFPPQRGDPKLQSAADLVVHSIRSGVGRVFERELKAVLCAKDAAAIYARVENSHGLLRSLYQNAAVSLVQAVDETVDAKELFPSMRAGMQQGQKLIRDLWDLRQSLRNELERAVGLDLNGVMDRIAKFREDSLRFLMYQDWGEFERCSEKLIMAGSELEARTLVRKFVGFLELLIQEVSKRSVLQ
jgi:hypothetical protein